MKRLGIVVLLFCLMSCETEEKIVDNSGRIEDIPTADNHMNEVVGDRKNKDVDVYKIVPENKQANDHITYQIDYYHNQAGQLNRYSGIIMSADDYQSFKFNWEDDTTVTVTLSGNAVEGMTMTLFGNINNGVPSSGFYVPEEMKEAAMNSMNEHNK